MANAPRVNLQSLAVELDLSIATVSRALRGVPGINEETRRRVLEKANAMGYSKHIEKELVKTQKNSRKLAHVLVLSESSYSQNDLRYMTGMSNAAIDANISILSHMVTHDQCASILNPKTAPVALRAGLVKGIVLLHRWPEDVARSLAAKYPMVSIVYDYPGVDIDFVGIDERRSFLEILTHLRAGGHQRIGFFGFCRQVSWSCSRNAAYYESLTRLGVPHDPRDTIAIGLGDAISAQPFAAGEWGGAVMERIRAGVDAWVCPSAMTSLSLKLHLIESGLQIPRDVALTGFHRGIFASSEASGSITTTSIVDEDLGLAAINRLIARIANPYEARKTILMPAKLVVGQSTRPVK